MAVAILCLLVRWRFASAKMILCARRWACYGSHRLTYEALPKKKHGGVSNKATKDLGPVKKKHLFRSSEWYDCYTVSISGTRLSFSLTLLPCPAQMYYKSASRWSVCQSMPTAKHTHSHTLTHTQPRPILLTPIHSPAGTDIVICRDMIV